MSGLSPGKDLRVKPYALSSSNTVPGRTDGDFDAGLDVKYGVTKGLTLDFTVNTDFSQVEADEQQINLSRFNLFFPEKRDFFLENSGIFGFGGGGNMGGGGATAGRQNGSQDTRLFFSRRIGLSDNGDAIPILAGTRLTGRQGRYSVGALNIQQREQGLVPATNFTALGCVAILANSDIGAMLLNKEESGTGYNRGRRRRELPLRTSTSTATPRRRSRRVSRARHGQDFATRASANYQDRQWQFRARYDTIGQRFNDEMGFVPRQGVNNTFLSVARTFRPEFLSKLGVRETRPHWQFDTFIRQNGGGLESRYQDFHWPLSFHDGGFMEVGVNPNLEEIRRPFTINGARGVQVGAGRYAFNEYFILWNTNGAARMSANLRYSTGEFYDGYRRAYSVGPAIRMNENLNAAVTVQINDIEVSTGSFVSTLVTGRVNYNFNTKMFVNALLQYNTDSQQWSSNLRFNIIHRPLSDFFLVYNERRDERSGDLLNRALIAKMTYLVAF